MKIQTLSLIIIVLLVNGRSLFAQDSTFTIKSFQPQNIKDGQILLELNGYNRGSSDNAQTAATPSEDENGSSDRFQYSFRTSPWLKYESPKSFYYLNQNIYYRQNSSKSNNNSSSAKLYPQLDYSPFEESTSNNQSNYFDGEISVSGGHYFVDKLGCGGQINIQYSDDNRNNKYEDKYEIMDSTSSYTKPYYKRRNLYLREYKDQDKIIDVNITIGPIYGKIYEGKYAAKAIEIIAELRNNGQLFNEPNSNQMEQLATIIYEEMNRSYYDSRIKHIESLGRINDYLNSEKITRETCSAFLTINDIYYYSRASVSTGIDAGIYQTFYRPYGFQIGLFLKGGYKEQMENDYDLYERTYYRTYYDSSYQIVSSDTSQYNDKTDFREVFGNRILGMKMSAIYAKPFGWHWHLITEAEIEYVKNDNIFKNWINTSITPNKFMTASYGLSSTLKSQLQYYLNSRTKIYLTQSISFGNLSESHSYNT